ncbi:MAG: YHYH protein [Leptolyngbyaceae cyanobacterium]
MRNHFSAIHLSKLEGFLGLLILLPLAACTYASSPRDVVGIVVGVEDFSTGRVSDVEVIDITGTTLTSRSRNCADYVATYNAEAIELPSNTVFIGSLTISVENDHCIFTSNAIPNHDMNDANTFATPVSEQHKVYRVTTSPQPNRQATALSPQYDNAVLLNGVKVDSLSGGCFTVRLGCRDATIPWRYNAISPLSFLKTDAHHAHTQPNGEYHYHGNPHALFDDSDNSKVSPVIGFAADGFPIFGSYFDDNGNIRKALSSYQLKRGERPSGEGNPGGTYDGEFNDDYEYVEGAGDLDDCNGMTIDGIYGYYVTEDYPYVIVCYRGTPDNSFRKTGSGGQSRSPSGGGELHGGSQ